MLQDAARVLPAKPRTRAPARGSVAMTWDAIVIGSGFGGSMAAHALVRGGQRVLMLERGGWVARGPESWNPHSVGLISPCYSMRPPYRVVADGRRQVAGLWQCVGGQSVFYGGASFRFRERDFEHDPFIVGDSEAVWPLCYADMEPFYARAEEMLGVAGESGVDPTEPPRSSPYPQCPSRLSRSSQLIADAATRLGMNPFRIPLAISYSARGTGRACINCGTCDGYACAAEAKNDLATGVIPELVRCGMALRTNTVCTRLVRDGSRVVAAEYVDRVTGEHGRLTARNFVLAAGTLATPHLVLASGLDEVSPARDAIGRYLTRHCNAVVLGAFRHRPNPEGAFDKQIAIHDFYHGAPSLERGPESGDDVERPRRPLGSIQQMTPSRGLVQAYLPRGIRNAAALVLSHLTGLLIIAEDEPRRENGVSLDYSVRDQFGLPGLQIEHRYSAGDKAAAAELIGRAKAVLREAGARFTIVHRIATFSHALGTMRMGCSARSSPLDADGRFRGLDNLYVTDGSALPRSAGVNPSLTIAANALRVGARLAPPGFAARPHPFRTLRVLDRPRTLGSL